MEKFLRWQQHCHSIICCNFHTSRNNLWPRNGNSILPGRRRPTHRRLLLLPRALPLRFHSLPTLHCFHLPSLPRHPLLRRRTPPFLSPMSSLTPPHTNSAKTDRVVIKGRVQGVFYRDWTVQNATDLGLKGWVRNRRDGSVEALFSGPPEKVQEMEERCRRGPPAAVVTGLETLPTNDDPGTGFERRPTV